jgi:LacI family transcriptional regulator
VTIDLKELSYRLGLSQTTVSRALNGYDDVSPKTRVRVSALAKSLGYTPNAHARQLARGRADSVGLVYPLDAIDLGDPRFLEFIEGLSDVMEAAQIDLLLASARHASELRTYERLVAGGRVDGFVVSRTRVHDPRIEYLQAMRIPFVAHGRTQDPGTYTWFDFDNALGSTLAVREMVRLGHQRIAYLHAPANLNFAHQRLTGFEQAMNEAGLRPCAIAEGGMSRRSGYAAGLELLARPDRPTAIIADNNLCGVGLVRALMDSKIAIGREMSVVVYDGVPSDTLLFDGQIASIEQPTAYESGRTVGDMLLNLINASSKNEELPLRQELRQPVLVPGDSLGEAP